MTERQEMAAAVTEHVRHAEETLIEGTRKQDLNEIQAAVCEAQAARPTSSKRHAGVFRAFALAFRPR